LWTLPEPLFFHACQDHEYTPARKCTQDIHFAATKATKSIDDDEEASDYDEEDEDEDDEALENVDLLALKLLELLRPELRRIEKMQNKQHRAISERLTKLEKASLRGFFLRPNAIPEIDPPADHISKKLKGQSPLTEGCTSATAIAPPPSFRYPPLKMTPHVRNLQDNNPRMRTSSSCRNWEQR